MTKREAERVGEVQHKVGLALNLFRDDSGRDNMRADKLERALNEAFRMCVDLRGAR
jgi:hypothetical protein